MMLILSGMVLIALAALWPLRSGGAEKKPDSVPPDAPAERHLANIRQLTFGRQNAEAYFSFDGSRLIFQSTNNWMKDTFAEALTPAETPLSCYQMYVMDLDGGQIRMVSTGVGATTCGCRWPPGRLGQNGMSSSSASPGSKASSGRWTAAAGKR